MKLFSQNASTQIRKPAVAGKFYPSDPGELRRDVERFLREARPVNGPAPKAIIAPHAGYAYSGAVAASAYAALAPAREIVRRVVLLGPAHRLPFHGLATSSAQSWSTPLGSVPLDHAAIEGTLALPQVSVLDAAHAGEHCIEVHLPFLQVVLAEFQIVPLVVGETTEDEVSEVIEALWGGEETRFVISSDLSHYFNYAAARDLDATTARAIEHLRPQDISEEQACGRIPIRGFLRAADHHGLRARTLDLRNSGDTSNRRDSVVGYGAWALE